PPPTWGRSEVKLGMIFTSRDEEDLEQRFLAWHRAQGVDLFLSTQVYGPERQSQGMTELQLLAHSERCDWVLDSDADEFWWSGRGTVKEVLERLPAGLAWALAQVTEFTPGGGRALAGHRNWMGLRLSPKVCHRPGPGIRVLRGNGGVLGAHGRGRTLPDLEVLHWPLRSPGQARRKCQDQLAWEGRDPRPARRLRGYRDLERDPEAVFGRIARLPSRPDDRLQRALGRVA
ncbi:MAG: hypothetical protein ACREN4_07270, partial [Candidatus Dormibacteria bacterium]